MYVYIQCKFQNVSINILNISPNLYYKNKNSPFKESFYLLKFKQKNTKHYWKQNTEHLIETLMKDRTRGVRNKNKIYCHCN